MDGFARARQVAAAGLFVALAGALPAQDAQRPSSGEPPWQAFVAAAGSNDREAREALSAIAAEWRDQYAAMIVDLARLLPSPRGPREIGPIGPDVVDEDGERSIRSGPGDPRHGPRPPGARVRQRLTSFLESQTGQRFGDNLRAWRRWIWELPDAPHGDYAAFKAEVYARIDPEFRAFFPPGVKHAVRLDEIDWGGVPVNGIPPLRSPQTVPAAGASWLREGHVVFGLEVNGEARAYPKRILAWHEMATDRLGGLDLTIVYCTLCGTVIPYESQVDGRVFTFGTSGLLYRSNKLMFDEKTRSLWSSLEGVPVVGPLVGAGLQLRFQSAVTTTWGEWRRDHPRTTVLSLDTGFTRDYSEGAAYREYFATDSLMFDVPATDRRLRNKAEVLVLRPELLGPDSPPVAIAVDLLKRTPVFAFDADARRFVVVTSQGGASRIYERGSVDIKARDRDGGLRDAGGARWRVTPDALVSDDGQRLPRVPSHQVFWFAWYAQHPDTVLHR